MIKLVKWKKVIPVALVFAGIFVFCALFLDNLVKLGVEKGCEAGFGAKAAIAKLDLRLKDFSLNIYKLQIANRNDFWKNLVDIGRIRAALDGNQLKFRRFIIDEMTIEELKMGTARKTSGELKKLFKPKEEKEKKSGGLDLGSLGVDQAKQLDKTVSIGELASGKETERIKNENAAKLAEVSKNAASLDVDKKLKAVDYSALENVGEIKDPNELNQKLKQIEAISQQLSQVQKDFENNKKAIQDNMQKIKENTAQLEDIKNKDLAKIYGKLNIGNYDMKQIGRSLLGPKINGYIDNITYYMYMAKKYMPPKKKSAPPKKERFKGFDVVFSKKEPGFLIRKIALSGTNSLGEVNEANYAGQILNISSDPAILGKPVLIDIKGKFTKNPRSSLLVKGILDHTKDVAEDKINFVVSGYKLSGQKLWDEKTIPLAIKSGDGTIQGDVTLRDSQLGGKIVFTGVNVVFEKLGAEKGSSQELLADAISSAGQIRMEITLSGPVDAPAIGVNTNLDKLVADQINKKLGDKVNAARKQVEDQYNKQLGAAQDEVKKATASQLQATNALIAKQQAILDSKTAELNAKKNEINQKLEDLKNEQVDKLKGQAQDLLKNALPR